MDTEPGRGRRSAHNETRLGVRRPAAPPVEVTGGTSLAGTPDFDHDHTQLGCGRPAPSAAQRTELGRGSAESEAAGTELGRRAPAERAAVGTGLGRRDHPEERAAGTELRFGPGVTAAPTWRSATGPATTTRRRRPRGGVAPALTAIAVVGVLAYLLLWRPPPLVVLGADVAPAVPPGASCDVTVDLVGTIRTNGEAGTIEYRWLRSDGETTAPVTQTVAADTPAVQVHLLWTLAGKGSYPARATLQIIQPAPAEAVGGFTYSCR